MIHKHKKKKSPKRCRSVTSSAKTPRLTCDILNCNRTVAVAQGIYGWVLGENDKITYGRAKTHYYKLCYYHHRRHINKKDKFDIGKIFKIEPAKVGVNVDRFGIPLPRDHNEIVGLIKREKEKEELEKKEKSLEKLTNWKASGGVRTKPKPRPKPIIESDLDNIINDILKII